MRNFQQIASGIDVMPLLLAVQRQPELWNQYKVRTGAKGSAHKGVDDIILRYNAFEKGDDLEDKVLSQVMVENYPAWALLPQGRALALAIMTRVEGVHLGRVFLARLAPGATVPEHSDRIDSVEKRFPERVPPAFYYERYHAVLSSGPGCLLRCGGEEATLGPGEVWWFNNQLPHEAINNSAADRIHLVLDICSGNGIYAPKEEKTQS